MPTKPLPLSNADAAWLNMERRSNLMMITGLFLFEQPVDFERLRQTLETRLLAFDRFRQRANTETVGRPRWVDDPDIDLDFHVLRAYLKEPDEESCLLELVGTLMAERLDRDRPLWQFHLVDYRGGSALIARLHHAIADGIALMKVLLGLTDSEPDAPWPSSEDLPAVVEGKKPRKGGLGRAFRRTARWLNKGNLGIRSGEVFDLAKKHVEVAADLGWMLLRGLEPNTPFKGKLGRKKMAAVSQPLCLERVKWVRQVFEATVNDVLLAALAGSLRSYLLAHNHPLEQDSSVRVVVPVDLRGPRQTEELGNQFGLVFLALPVGQADPRERLEEVKRRMGEIKNSPQAVFVFGLLNAVGVIPAELEKRVIELFGSKASGVVTNVPGPQQPLYLAGQKIDSLMFWVPKSGRLGLGVSILSYNMQVRVGVATDARLIPDPDQLVAGFHDAFEELAAAAEAKS